MPCVSFDTLIQEKGIGNEIRVRSGLVPRLDKGFGPW